jgi:hypothetical protein
MGFFSSLFGKREPEPAPPAEDPADAIDSEDGAERVDALRALVERWRSGNAQAAELIAPRLPDLLEDPEPLVRAAALSAVRLLQKPEILEKCESAVLALLADSAPRVRTAAIWAAMRIPGEAARTQVRAALGSTEESMRFAAACALAEARDSAALPELLAARRSSAAGGDLGADGARRRRGGAGAGEASRGGAGRRFRSDADGRGAGPLRRCARDRAPDLEDRDGRG